MGQGRSSYLNRKQDIFLCHKIKALKIDCFPNHVQKDLEDPPIFWDRHTPPKKKSSWISMKGIFKTRIWFDWLGCRVELMLLHLSTASSPAEDFSKFQADMGQRRAAGEAPGPRKNSLEVEGPSEGLGFCFSSWQKNAIISIQLQKVWSLEKNVKICEKNTIIPQETYFQAISSSSSNQPRKVKVGQKILV